MIQETSSGIVVFLKEKEFKFLVLHYAEGHWDLPKGHIEEGETEEQAALRETKEETGIAVDIEKGFREEIAYFFTGRNHENIRKNVVFFLGKATHKLVELSVEHIGFEWLDYEGAVKKVTYDSAKEVLKKAKAFLER